MLKPNFARAQISDLGLEHRHSQNLLSALPKVGDDGWTAKVDLQPLFFRLTLDSATQFLFGKSVDSQLANMPGATGSVSIENREVAFAEAFETAQSFLIRRARLTSKYWLLNPREFSDAVKRCHDFIDYYVHRALADKHDSEEPERQGEGEYIFLNALARQTQDPLEIRSQLISILLAGRDTTASLLGYTLYLLARHPEVYEKLRTEVLAAFGGFQEEDHSITFAGLKDCHYLQYCLNESLRLEPVAPLNARKCFKDTTLPTGGGPDGKSPIFVQAGMEIRYSVYVMHRNKDLWGEDADEFKPERWKGRKGGWDYLPFNGGPRVSFVLYYIA